ncbi:DUF2637 domain-containing protein [Kitasatospora sp. NPDC059795]|uniref:DUF2637 domain-containing protein n=1 Tax=Kitasatospora sp. NPDC059795 TaxID=3346949 RepID=UPI0036613C10
MKLPRPKVSPWDITAIGLLGGTGFALSYDALQQMAQAVHIRGQLTYAFPVVVDGFIAYGVRALVLLREAPLVARAYTWSLFAGATGTSVWANALHAVRLNQVPGQAADNLKLGDVPVAFLSTIAPLALAGAVHLGILINRHNETPTATDGPEPDSPISAVAQVSADRAPSNERQLTNRTNPELAWAMARTAAAELSTGPTFSAGISSAEGKVQRYRQSLRRLAREAKRTIQRAQQNPQLVHSPEEANWQTTPNGSTVSGPNEPQPEPTAPDGPHEPAIGGPDGPDGPHEPAPDGPHGPHEPAPTAPDGPHEPAIGGPDGPAPDGPHGPHGPHEPAAGGPDGPDGPHEPAAGGPDGPAPDGPHGPHEPAAGGPDGPAPDGPHGPHEPAAGGPDGPAASRPDGLHEPAADPVLLEIGRAAVLSAGRTSRTIVRTAIRTQGHRASNEAIGAVLKVLHTDKPPPAHHR